MRTSLMALAMVVLLILPMGAISYLSLDSVYAFQPFPTVRPQPATFELPFTTTPPAPAHFSRVSAINSDLRTEEIPMPLAWAAGALTVVTAMLGGLSFLGRREVDRPRIFPLILTAILLTVVTLLVELLFVAAEAILITSGIAETPPGVLLGIVLAGLGLVLIDFDLAFVIYVYRVANGSAGEEVKLNLWPWEGWGLSP